MLSHPISTLFPYTTLFRSNELRGARGVLVDEDHHGWIDERAPGRGLDEIEHLSAVARGVDDAFVEELVSDELRLIQDRKSTRLNSSHLGISYAVFCLKKNT